MEKYEIANKILDNKNSNEVVDLFELKNNKDINMHDLKKARIKNLILEIKELIFKDIDNHFYEDATVPNNIQQSREKSQFVKHIEIVFKDIVNVDISCEEDLDHCSKIAKNKLDMFDVSIDKKYGDIVMDEIININELDFSIWFKKTYDL